MWRFKEPDSKRRDDSLTLRDLTEIYSMKKIVLNLIWRLSPFALRSQKLPNLIPFSQKNTPHPYHTSQLPTQARKNSIVASFTQKKNMQMQTSRRYASKELGGLPYLFQGNTGNGRHQKSTLQPFRRTHLGWPGGWKMRGFLWEDPMKNAWFPWIWGMIPKSYAKNWQFSFLPNFLTLERQV